jgi:hypothetical protein
MWLRVLRDLDWIATANITSKLQTHSLVREGAPQHEDCKMSDSNKNLVTGPRWGSTPRQTGGLTVDHKII